MSKFEKNEIIVAVESGSFDLKAGSKYIVTGSGGETSVYCRCLDEDARGLDYIHADRCFVAAEKFLDFQEGDKVVCIRCKSRDHRFLTPKAINNGRTIFTIASVNGEFVELEEDDKSEEYFSNRFVVVERHAPIVSPFEEGGYAICKQSPSCTSVTEGKKYLVTEVDTSDDTIKIMQDNGTERWVSIMYFVPAGSSEVVTPLPNCPKVGQWVQVVDTHMDVTAGKWYEVIAADSNGGWIEVIDDVDDTWTMRLTKISKEFKDEKPVVINIGDWITLKRDEGSDITFGKYYEVVSIRNSYKVFYNIIDNAGYKRDIAISRIDTTKILTEEPTEIKGDSWGFNVTTEDAVDYTEVRKALNRKNPVAVIQSSVDDDAVVYIHMSLSSRLHSQDAPFPGDRLIQAFEDSAAFLIPNKDLEGFVAMLKNAYNTPFVSEGRRDVKVTLIDMKGDRK